MIFGAPLAENVPTPIMGRKKAPNSIALSFSHRASWVSSWTSLKKLSVRCICAGSVQRTPRTCGSRAASNCCIDSGRSMATKRRLGIKSKRPTLNAERPTLNSIELRRDDRARLQRLGFCFVFALELCIHVRTGAHHSRRDGGDMDVVACQLGANRIGETGQRKFADAVWREMRHGDLAANGRNINDVSSTPGAHFRNDLRN